MKTQTTDQMSPRLFVHAALLFALVQAPLAFADDSASPGLLKAFAELDAQARARSERPTSAPEQARAIDLRLQEKAYGDSGVASRLAYIMGQETLPDLSLSEFNQMRPQTAAASGAHFSKQRADAPNGNADAWRRRVAGDAPSRPAMDRSLSQALSYGLAKIDACWERAQWQAGSKDGRVVLNIKLNAAGRVERVSTMTDTMANDELNKCILAAATRLQTAGRLGDTVYLELPLNFSVEKVEEHAHLD